MVKVYVSQYYSTVFPVSRTWCLLGGSAVLNYWHFSRVAIAPYHISTNPAQSPLAVVGAM